MFVPAAYTPPKAGAKELLCSLNLIHKFASLFSRNVIYAGLLGKAFPRKQAFVDIRVFLWFRKQRPRFAQGHPKGYFQLKQLHKTTKAYCSNECWLKGGQGPVCWVQCANMCQDLQFDSCAEKDSLCGTVMIHDGLNLRCLDQCHGVRSQGKGSSQSWRKRSVIRQSEFDPWVYTSLHPCSKPTWFMQVCLGKPSCEIMQR